MKLIRMTPNESGAYPSIQEMDSKRVPSGMAVWPDTLPTDDFYAHCGFVRLDIADGAVRGYAPNVEAWAVWQAEQPPEPDPERAPTEAEDAAALLVDQEYRLTLLELGVTGDEG